MEEDEEYEDSTEQTIPEPKDKEKKKTKYYHGISEAELTEENLENLEIKLRSRKKELTYRDWYKPFCHHSKWWETSIVKMYNLKTIFEPMEIKVFRSNYYTREYLTAGGIIHTGRILRVINWMNNDITFPWFLRLSGESLRQYLVRGGVTRIRSTYPSNEVFRSMYALMLLVGYGYVYMINKNKMLISPIGKLYLNELEKLLASKYPKLYKIYCKAIQEEFETLTSTPEQHIMYAENYHKIHDYVSENAEKQRKWFSQNRIYFLGLTDRKIPKDYEL